jgi:hypothetical protein
MVMRTQSSFVAGPEIVDLHNCAIAHGLTILIPIKSLILQTKRSENVMSVAIKLKLWLYNFVPRALYFSEKSAGVPPVCQKSTVSPRLKNLLWIRSINPAAARPV